MTMTDTQGKNADRRAQRSIRSLKEAFFELMREKGFSSITIQDIADRADVGRGTFYAHFPDKYAALETAIREKFHRSLDSRLPPAASWEKSHLHLLILTVLEHFKEMYGQPLSGRYGQPAV
ncbi:TetR/AcrR family transcriptional regulator [Paenibacillus sp. P26]|nr:TetR/AcrR family transcriptional regulator [Paenibacillus sp. P26]